MILFQIEWVSHEEPKVDIFYGGLELYVMFYMMLALCIIVYEFWLNYLHNCIGCIWYDNPWTWPTNVGAEGTRPIPKFFEKKNNNKV